ncbi:MAG: hypothetical protein ACI4T4_02230, partial [Limosilactobacillus sp.]
MKKYTQILSGIGCWLVFAVFLKGVYDNADWVHQLDRLGYLLLQPTTTARTQLFTVITHLGDPLILLPLSLFVGAAYWWRHQLLLGIKFASLQIGGYLLVIA